MTLPDAKGWCPGVLRPMMSGDGLLVRVRPPLGRLTGGQVDALCTAAVAHGSGMLDLTSRANIQIRGVRPDRYERLLVHLVGAGLVDGDAEREARNNILVAPHWQQDDDSWHIATQLAARLGELPKLPTKFGFAIDAVEGPVLRAASADIRVERGVSGRLVVRTDGAAEGELTAAGDAVDRVIELCCWFVETGGMTSKRMARHVARPRLTGGGEREAAVCAADALVPGPTPIGPAYGAPFGRLTARGIAELFEASGAAALRTTPWRLFILEGGRQVESAEFFLDPADPIRRVDACPGAPFCPSATVETRTLARDLSGVVPGLLHVSGCAKGCARPSSASVTIVGREGRFDIVRDGCASDSAEVTGLEAEQVAAHLGAG